MNKELFFMPYVTLKISLQTGVNIIGVRKPVFRKNLVRSS